MDIANVTSRAPMPLTVCCGFGDPWSPWTWSGTPLNLCNALQSAGLFEEAVNARSLGGRVMSRVIATKSYLRYGGDPQHFRGRVMTSAHAAHVQRRLGVKERHVLHLGNDHLPFAHTLPNQRHYLYIDSTAKSVQERSTGSGWKNARLLKDVDAVSRETMAQMDHIFTISADLKRLLVDQYGVSPQKISPVGTGRGPIYPTSEPKSYEGRTILFVAKRQFAEKGGELLLQAFEIAHRTNPTLRLVIAGQNEYLKQFKGIPGVIVHGRISFDELQSLFHRADLFAMPALYEPWGLVYLEALSCRVPVFGLRRNALPEITQEGRFGFLCERDDPSCLAAVLLDALSDIDRLRRMGELGQEHCLKYYTWEQTVARIMSIIHQPTSTPMF